MKSIGPSKDFKIQTEDNHQVYMDGDKGPFRCDNCEYYINENSCNEKHIIELAHQNKFGLKMFGQYALVKPDSCSDYFSPKGKK